jgi:flavin-dependent dehydrogenase
MSEAGFDADVCVVGGGPAGAALACRLAKLGHSVVVVERHPFPRPHVGESLSPGAWSLLEVLGARAAVEAERFPRPLEARVRWGAPEVRRPLGAEPGVSVDRGVFDRLLLDRAGEAGATVLQPAVARRPVKTAAGWEAGVLAAGGPLTLRARFLADASGRARLLGGTRRRTSPRTVALHALWGGVDEGKGRTHVEALPESWLWGTHLPGGRFRAMAFVDPGLVRRSRQAGEGIESLYRELLAGSSLFRHLPATGRLEGRVAVCDATCYADNDPIGPTWAKVGEAGFTIDPLSSSGVQTAIQAGITAGVVIHTILSADGDAGAASAYFREHQRHAVEHHVRLSAEAYRDCAEFAANLFWRRRADGPPPPPGATAVLPLGDLLPRCVRLSPAVELRPAPCVVGDRVELRRALSHPTLPRPVAYLGGVELAPLLDRLTADRVLRDVVEDWTGSVPADMAHAIAGWLAGRGLLAPA